MWIGRGDGGMAMGGMAILAAEEEEEEEEEEEVDLLATAEAALFEASNLSGVMLVWRMVFWRGLTASQEGFWW